MASVLLQQGVLNLSSINSDDWITLTGVTMPYCHLSHSNNGPLWLDKRETFTTSLREREREREKIQRERKSKSMSQAESGEKLRGTRGKEKGGREEEREGGKSGRREGVELESGRRLLLWPDVKLSTQLQLSSTVFSAGF